jgi:hypothetical protein
MSLDAATEALQRALEISREVAQLAEGGDVARALALDAERLELLRSARAGLHPLSDDARSLVGEIATLNDRAVGFLEHRLRGKARELDMAAVGRRALLAYSATGQRT